ncbi:TetR/AcrR family transcriptional regulator [uncultured Methanoregula sp.]|uniref:TetR/AcrR family transcriptional regulator n=1 Tax=uncultured Methanoregula sp. TaxID=1005933 RepID=UPI002AABE974|nr:TetR/AcrR family transcriptional regulator [uncultured Methanoregula sp.]
MGINERKQREKEQRKKEILDAAERLFFSRGYEDVSMDEIAREVELNKATLYLYFKNKEALFAAIVLRGVRILQEKYEECMNTRVPGIVKVGLMGQAYYRFSQEHPDYQRLIHFYGTERFSKDNPCTAEIGKGYGTCRMILRDAVQEGIDDGTIRADLDPFLISMYLMISFMGILSMEDKWKRVIEAEGFSYEQYSGEFFRFISPAVSTGGASPIFSGEGTANLSSTLFISMDPVITGHPEQKPAAGKSRKK